MDRPPLSAVIRARELFAAAWEDYCRTFYEDDRAALTIVLRKIRQELYDEHDVDVGKYFLAMLPGFTGYMDIVRSGDKRFTWD